MGIKNIELAIIFGFINNAEQCIKIANLHNAEARAEGVSALVNYHCAYIGK